VKAASTAMGGACERSSAPAAAASASPRGVSATSTQPVNRAGPKPDAPFHSLWPCRSRMSRDDDARLIDSSWAAWY